MLHTILSQLHERVSRLEHLGVFVNDLQELKLEGEEGEEHDECEICCHGYRDRLSATRLPCGHVFHTACVDRLRASVSAERQAQCPLCRAYIDRSSEGNVVRPQRRPRVQPPRQTQRAQRDLQQRFRFLNRLPAFDPTRQTREQRIEDLNGRLRYIQEQVQNIQSHPRPLTYAHVHALAEYEAEMQDIQDEINIGPGQPRHPVVVSMDGLRTMSEEDLRRLLEYLSRVVDTLRMTNSTQSARYVEASVLLDKVRMVLAEAENREGGSSI